MSSSTDAGPVRSVLVTGAGGRTGGIVFEKLLKKEGYTVKGMVRSEQVCEQKGKADEVENLCD